MGKIRVKTLGVEEVEEKQKKQARLGREGKEARKKAEEKKASSNVAKLEVKNETVEEKEKLAAEPAKAEEKKTVNTEKKKKSSKVSKKQRSPRYKTSVSLVEKKPYTLSDALDLLEKMNKAKFDETVELHFNTVETGVSGTITLPHGTGKQTRVAIADDKVLAQVEKGKIDFDVLIASPDMMPKLAKVARILGPRGLMPNPKNGTITKNPEEVIKKYAGGHISFKTEAKAAVIHLSVGKMSFGKQKLSENIKTVINAIQTKKIQKAILKSTMSPAIKLNLEVL